MKQLALRSSRSRPPGDPSKDLREEVTRSEAARAATRRRKVKRQLLVDQTVEEIKAAPCLDCGLRFPPPSMHFDHISERGAKLFNVSNFRRQPTRSLQVLLDEIAKCDLVCANCHAVREWNRLHPDRTF